MKVELLVNLLTSEGLLEKGKIFDDPLPADIWDEINLNRPTVKILSDTRGVPQEELIKEDPPVVIEEPKEEPKIIVRKRGRKAK